MFYPHTKRKVNSKAIILMMLFCLLVPITHSFAQLNWSFAVGNLKEDPASQKLINSPYLSFHKGDEQSWIAYSPSSTEGRFYKVSSSLSGAIAAGYVKGRFDFLDKKLITPKNQSTGIVVNVSTDKALKWSYVHENGLLSSEFLSVIKLSDGRAIVSGWEKRKGQKPQAILLCIGKEAKVIWKKSIVSATGSVITENLKGVFTWLVVEIGTKGKFYSLFQVNKFDGTLKKIVSSHDPVADLPRNKKEGVVMTSTATGDLIIAQPINSKLSITKYKPNGEKIWSKTISCQSDIPSPLIIKGVTVRQSGNLQLAADLVNDLSLNKNQSLKLEGHQNLLLITLDSQGNFLGFEQYGDQYTTTNGFYKNGTQRGILGGHEGVLKVQDQTLTYEQELLDTKAYQIYLAEYPWVDQLESLVSDPTQLATYEKLNIYPNPVVNGQVTIVNPEVPLQTPYQIYLYGTDGKLAKAVGKIAENTSTKDKIDVADLSIGLYHVFFLQNNEIQRVGRIIISQ